MSPEDFEDKPTKIPASSTVSEMTSEDSSIGSKTTKPWTSNTIDIDEGMPTRHRRETEDTLSPASTKSTTDLSNHETHKSKLTVTISNDEIETTSISPERDVTIDASVSSKSNKSTQIKTTQVTDLTTQNGNTQTEVTTEPKMLNTEIEDTGEYPAAINQGQLFSIIENGKDFYL